jgi:hypothetical protein
LIKTRLKNQNNTPYKIYQNVKWCKIVKKENSLILSKNRSISSKTIWFSQNPLPSSPAPLLTSFCELFVGSFFW